MATETPTQIDAADLRFYQRLTFFVGVIYFLWWFAVEFFLPHSFNPLFGRLCVVVVILALGALSYASVGFQRHIHGLFIIGLWLISAHYFYLFYFNKGDINWVLGSYITVMATTFALMTNAALLSYTTYIILLSMAMMYLLPPLRTSIFFPGLLTILLQANIGYRFRKRAADEHNRATALAENIRVRDEFISMASHELKTPLSALRLQVQILDMDFTEGKLQSYTAENFQAFLGVFNRQVSRLAELVETMLDVSRISAGQLTLQKRETEVAAIVRDVIESIRIQHTELGEKEIEIESPSTLSVWADPDRLAQVVENILSNAVKYGRHKNINVSAKIDGEYMILAVTDHGQGIAAEFLPKIFDRFDRGGSSRNISGLGLGLYIAKQIVESHSGTIDVVSRVDEGSTFTVRIPTRAQ